MKIYEYGIIKKDLWIDESTYGVAVSQARSFSIGREEKVHVRTWDQKKETFIWLDCFQDGRELKCK